MLTMTQIDYIRKAFFEEGKNISQIAKIYRRDRKTVRRYINQDDFNENPKTMSVNPHSKLDNFKPLINQWLVDDLKHKRKQRHTARRVFRRLNEETQDFNCSYKTVANYVSQLKKQLYKPEKAALPLEHPCGEAQADFGEAEFQENGVTYYGKYLVLSFPYSNAGYYQLFKGETRECLFEGLKNIFEHIGGVPAVIRFDNTSTIVTNIKKGGERELTEAFLRFKAHYGFTAQFCNPSAGYEKGNVENKVRYSRLNQMVPVPVFKRLKDYNQKVLKDCDLDQEREHYRFNETIAERFKKDKAALLDLPSVPFDCSTYVYLKTDLYGKFKLNKQLHTYSSAPSLAGRTICVRLTSGTVEPLNEKLQPVTVHSRLYGGTKQEKMDWLPYLTQLSRKPGALKYTGIYQMLPEPVQNYMESLDRSQKGALLKILADLTQRSNFTAAVESVSRSINLNQVDEGSIKAIHAYLTQDQVVPSMVVSRLPLPHLPPFKTNVAVYDAMLGLRKVTAR
jgi:transposase